MRTPHIILSSASPIQGLPKESRERIKRMYTRWAGLRGLGGGKGALFAWVCDCVWVLASFGFLVLVLLGVVCLFICLGGFFGCCFLLKG